MENSMDSADFIIGVTINSGIAFVRLLPADTTITAQTYRQQAGRQGGERSRQADEW